MEINTAGTGGESPPGIANWWFGLAALDYSSLFLIYFQNVKVGHEFFTFIYFIFYLFLAVLGLRCCVQPFSS